jgi:hypothetical protein
MAFAPTSFATAQGGINFEDPEQVAALQQYAGSIFGMFRQFGASGEVLGTVLQMMLTGFVNMSNTEVLDGVYLLNASQEVRTEGLSYNYGSPKAKYFNPWGIYNLNDPSVPTQYRNEAPYVRVTEGGTVTYNKTEGVAVTFFIWDSDGSFIAAIDELINTVKEFMDIQQSGENDDAKIKAATSAAAKAITYFLIHINDIINGDEVIVMNLIAYTEFEVDWTNGNVDVDWFVTQNRRRTDTVTLDSVYPDWKADYTQIATDAGDETMLSLIAATDTPILTRQEYTQFSFDLVEVWLKNFQVRINVDKLMDYVAQTQNSVNNMQEPNAPEFTLTEVFQGLDIEFYIFTHHFQNWYLYDDTKFDDVRYNDEIRALAGNGKPDVAMNRTDPEFQFIVDSEVTDYIQFRGDDWSIKPVEKTADGKGIEWGVHVDDLTFRVIPVGLKPEDVDETTSPIEYMEFYDLGFTFEPKRNDEINGADYVNGGTTETMGHAKVKLNQAFGTWNNGNGPNTARVVDRELDLTTLFMSTILHVHLAIENGQISDAPTEGAMLNETDYEEVNSRVRVGDEANGLPLADIDIIGPGYYQAGSTTLTPAVSNIIPTMYASVDAFASNTYNQADNSTGQMNVTLDVEFSVLLYAVAYPTFNGSGDEMIHDPTFSIFIKIENPGVMAILLVVGVVSLVGIAAILITKKKNAAAGI